MSILAGETIPAPTVNLRYEGSYQLDASDAFDNSVDEFLNNHLGTVIYVRRPTPLNPDRAWLRSSFRSFRITPFLVSTVVRYVTGQWRARGRFLDSRAYAYADRGGQHPRIGKPFRVPPLGLDPATTPLPGAAFPQPI